MGGKRHYVSCMMEVSPPRCYERDYYDDVQCYVDAYSFDGVNTREERIEALRLHIETEHPVSDISEFQSNYGCGRPALHRAVWYGMKKRCEELLERGARVDDLDDMRLPPIAIAARSGYTDICQLFLQHGQTTGVDPGVKHALTFAAHSGHTDLCHLLLDIPKIEPASCHLWDGAPNYILDDDHVPPALSAASEGGHIELCKLFLSRGDPVDEEDGEGRTALSYAAVGCHPDVCQLLLDHGADIEHKSNDGDSALDAATENGCLVPRLFDTCKLLLSRGADGHKALMTALSENNFPTAQCLLENGADPMIEEPRRQFALSIAIEYLGRFRYLF